MFQLPKALLLPLLLRLDISYSVLSPKTLWLNAASKIRGAPLLTPPFATLPSWLHATSVMQFASQASTSGHCIRPLLD
ncbi:hypothetical protein BDV41DRAFT_535932 [Aspergillus transmontanensis]|uniref:Secreted protein n=1 Tax=Aspergillus transmontanensis TaxID=1034304 RepID=A0A5N6W1C7_9EURO|nr:hypothetical protein BDV41DRAFT_535932 [Aspergillus transmontanensis]